MQSIPIILCSFWQIQQGNAPVDQVSGGVHLSQGDLVVVTVVQDVHEVGVEGMDLLQSQYFIKKINKKNE